jgi:hypothetical protein
MPPSSAERPHMPIEDFEDLAAAAPEHIRLGNQREIFLWHGEWSASNGILMNVEITSYDRDNNTVVPAQGHHP